MHYLSSVSWVIRVSLSSPHTFRSSCTYSLASPMPFHASLSLDVKVTASGMTFPFLLIKSNSQLTCYFLCVKSWFLTRVYSSFHIILNSYLRVYLSHKFPQRPGLCFTHFWNPRARQIFVQFVYYKWLHLWP